MRASIRVLLADDHPIVREGIRDVCDYGGDMELVGVALDSEQAQKLLLQFQPDVVLLDINMPDDSVNETIHFTHQYCPHTKILIFSGYCEPVQIQKLIGDGINGYVLKSEEPNALLSAIRAAAKGECWFSQHVLKVLSQQPDCQPPQPLLTPREAQILDLIGKGYENQQIADELHVSKQTVANYISCIYEKLGVQTRAEAMLWQIKNRKG